MDTIETTVNNAKVQSIHFIQKQSCEAFLPVYTPYSQERTDNVALWPGYALLYLPEIYHNSPKYGHLPTVNMQWESLCCPPLSLRGFTVSFSHSGSTIRFVTPVHCTSTRSPFPLLSLYSMCYQLLPNVRHMSAMSC